MKTTKLDLTGHSKKEIKILCELHGYSLSTYYSSINRNWIIVETTIC